MNSRCLRASASRDGNAGSCLAGRTRPAARWVPRACPHRVAACLALVCGVLCLCAEPARAQTAGAPGPAPGAATPAPVVSRDAAGHLVIRATRITQPLSLDGRLDEAVYSQVPPITEFIQQVPKEGAPASEKTEMWIFFDDRNVYVTCRLWDDHPERIVANDMRRDSPNLARQDRCDASFDTLHDGRSNYLFTLTPLGGLRDGLGTDEVQNFDWNGVWEGAARRFDGGWLAEMAVPFKTLRYQPGRTQVWGVILRRIIQAKNESVYVTPVSAAWGPAAVNHMSAAATLVGIEAPPAAHNIEVKPYAIARTTTNLVTQPSVRNHVEPDGGIDVTYGVTKSLTGSLSYRTDFAEAEADDAQLNLTRFSLFFPEKREFFLEGQGLFQFGSGGAPVAGAVAPTIFYSRRIGLNGEAMVPVIGGARLTGRAGPWSIGAINMTTEADATSRGARTNFSVVRVRHDLFRRSNIGGIATLRSQSIREPGANAVVGLDANFALLRDVYFSAYAAKSRTAGISGRDLSYRAQFNYAADRYGLQFDRNVVQANFNPEVGFLARPDFRRTFGSARFSPRTKKSRVVRRYSWQADLDSITDNESRLSTRLRTFGFLTEFHNSDTLQLQLVQDYERLTKPFQIARSVCLPAGGYSFDNAVLVYSGGTQRPVNGAVSFEAGMFYNGNRTTVGWKGRASLSPKLSVEPTISLNRIDLVQGAFTSTVLGARTVFTMTPRMFAAALIQHASGTSSLSANVRFRWEYQPGSELFLVYTEGRSTLTPPGNQLQTRGIVVKINRLFRW